MRELELIERDKIMRETKYVEDNLAELNLKLQSMSQKQNKELKTQEFKFIPSQNQSISPSEYDHESSVMAAKHMDILPKTKIIQK